MPDLLTQIESIRPLAASDLSAPALPAPAAPSLSNIRATHHRLAQLLGNGVVPIVAGRLCGFGPGRVQSLLDDPAFQELKQFYEGRAEEEWNDINRLMADMSADFLQHLRELLDDHPERFSASVTMEAIKILADRSGHGPTSKSVQVNLNADVGDRLAAARARKLAAAATVTEGEFTVVEK